MKGTGDPTTGGTDPTGAGAAPRRLRRRGRERSRDHPRPRRGGADRRGGGQREAGRARDGGGRRQHGRYAGAPRGAGATVVQSPTRDFSGLKNWALDHLPLSAEWVLHMDADERLTPALVAEIRGAARGASRADAYHVRRRIVFMGRAIRHGGLYPAAALRLFRRGRARYDGRAVHERLMCPGQTGALSAPMLHLRRGPISRYVERMIHYADLESDEWVAREAARIRGGSRRAPDGRAGSGGPVGGAPCGAGSRCTS